MKQGQVTIFFSIGLVLLIVFALVIYVATLAPNEEPERRASTQAKQYLASCLDTAMYDALDTLGTQGGAFFDNINDLDNNIPGALVTLSGETYTIAYGIMLPSLESYSGPGNLTDLLNANTDGIPPVDAQDPRITYTSTLFGTITLPALCEPDGPNSKSQTTNTHCGPYAYERINPAPGHSEHTIQGALTRKLTGALNNCLAQDVQDRIGDTEIYNNPALTITLGEQAIVLDTLFPDAPEANIHKEYPVRLLTLYNYITELLVLETRDYRYPLEDGRLGEPTNPRLSVYYRNGFYFDQQVIGQDLLYTFVDDSPSFRYRGTQLTFNFLIQDRPPFEDNNGLTGDPDE